MTLRHTVDLSDDMYTDAARLASEWGLALTDVTRGLYRLWLTDPALQARVPAEALTARAELNRSRKASS